MGIFTFNKKLSFIQEADINGQSNNEEDNNEDYTAGADDDINNSSPSESDSSATSENDEEDYTAGADGEVSTDDTSESGDDTSDSNISDTDSNTGEDSGVDDGEEIDYTAGADGEVSTDDTSESGDETSENENNEGENSENQEDNLKKIESELFSSLTPEQIAIKNRELKSRFIEIYGTIGATLVRINDIPKSDDNIELLKFVTDKLLELRDIVDVNITTSYQTRTYIENNIIYQQCLSTLDAISDIISNIPVPSKTEEESDKEDALEDNENKPEGETLDVSDKMQEENARLFDFDL